MTQYEQRMKAIEKQKMMYAHPPSILEVDESVDIFPPTQFINYCTTKKV